MGCNCKLREKLNKLKHFYNPSRMVYLDYNATTPPDPAVIGAVDRALRDNWANPSSLHVSGLAAYQKIEEAKKAWKDYFQCPDGQVYFCSSGSEAIHAAIQGILSRIKSCALVTTSIEHSAVTHITRHLCRKSSLHAVLPVDQNGQMDLDALDKVLKRNSNSLLVYSPVNHETGSIQPVKEIAKIARQYQVMICLDAVQAALRLKPQDWVPYCDLFCMSGHKLYAPKGTAGLWVKKGVRLRPFRYGGYQEGGVFPGTQNISGIIALSKALVLFKEQYVNEKQIIKALTQDALRLFQKESFSYNLESPPGHCPGTLCISLPFIKDMERFMLYLSEKNICLSRFSACNSKLSGSSKILLAMGRSRMRSQTSLRISFGRWSKLDDFYRLIRAIKSYTD